MDILNCTPIEWYNNEDKLLEQLNKDNVWNKVPLLNVNELHNHEDLKLVRFRGMIQDMHGPEYYLERFEVINDETKKVSLRVGKYIDIASCEPNEIVNEGGSSVIRSERQSYVAISIPAVNEWAKKLEEDQYKLPSSLSSTSSTQTKRNSEQMEVENCQSSESPTSFKKQCKQPEKVDTTNIVLPEHLLNFPIPDCNGKVCHLKIYKNFDSIKLNSVCEFIGFLSVNPSIASHDENEMEDVEFQVHNPPPSLIPRIHVISFKELQHNNPLVQENMAIERMSVIRKELLIFLTQLMCGDELAAEYLIYNLISKVYLRKDFMALGKFSLNISNVPKFENVDFVHEVYQFIAMLVTKSHYLAMSLENMNELIFVPKKDYTANRLTSSILQLSANTHLVIDETKLSAGKLNEAGVSGIKAISNAIKNQKTMYDFTYYQIEFDCDIPFLIFSEGKSMLPSDVHVKLEPENMHLNTFNEILQAAKHFLKPELLNEIRVYLTSARLVEYEILDNVQQLVQNEFVKMRQNGSVSADDLHNLLVLARLVSISQGKSTLDEESWKKACSLEESRKERLNKRTST